MKKLFLMLILSILLISFASATCIVILDKENYAPTETATAQMVCDNKDEQSETYSLIWTNQTGTTIETDSSITPSSKNEVFYETYTIPSGYAGHLNATLTGTEMEGTDGANVSGASANTLLITNAVIGGKWLGLTSSIKATVKDEKDKLITGGKCIVSVWSNDETTMQERMEAIMINGEVKTNWISNYESFAEAKDYAVKIICYCGSDSSSTECIDEDGLGVEDSTGITTSAFTTNSWLTVNEYPLPITYQNGTSYSEPSLYSGFDTVYFKRNLTNNQGTELKAIKEIYIVNNDTGQIYDISKTLQSPILTGNSSTIFGYKIPQEIETGVYYLKIFADVYYNDIQVVSKIMPTDTFNVTGIQDIMTINSITIKDYWGNTVNTSSGVLSSSSMPSSNWTDPYTVLTEGFGYQICGNITNSYTSDIYWHMQNLILHNPTTGESYEEFHRKEDERWQRSLPVGDTDICWISTLPLKVNTHSDYHFDFDIYIGDENEPFDCETNCEYGGDTDYFYIGAIEDSITFDKWITEPTDSAQGVPGIFIVTEREEYLSMNNDCNYTDQETTDWGNASFLCNKKDGGGQLMLNLSEYPIAGEEIRVCFQSHNYLRREVDLEFFDIFIDSDQGETSVFFQGEQTNGYIPSITEDKLYLSEAPSRANELGGNLVDSYGITCSNWLNIPHTLDGGNNWDIQGKVRINSDIYNFEEEVIWNWESDEFPIFGARLDENFVRLVDITNISTSANQGTIAACTDITVNFTYDYLGNDEDTFLAQYCFEQTDHDDITKCYERLINPDRGIGNKIIDTFKLPYFETAGNAEVDIKILGMGQKHNLNELLGFADLEPYNTFTVTIDSSDSCKYSSTTEEWFDYREAAALEGIENKTGTFHLDVNCPSTGTIGSDMNCVITAYVEDSQTVEKEVDFTCYILDGTTQSSSVNFNQMITRSPLLISQDFLIPSTSTEGQYILQCNADYYNLGSRRDSFYDTFTASTSANGGSSGGTGTTSPEEETPDTRTPITGGIIGIGEALEGESYNPLTPKGKRIYTLSAVILLLVAALIFVTAKIRTKCKDKFHPIKPRYHKSNLLKIIAGLSIFLLALLFVALGIYALGANLINAFQSSQESIIKDPLFRTIILSAFIIASIIILFKALNIRAEIKIGYKSPIEKYWKKRHKD